MVEIVDGLVIDILGTILLRFIRVSKHIYLIGFVRGVLSLYFVDNDFQILRTGWKWSIGVMEFPFVGVVLLRQGTYIPDEKFDLILKLI